MALLAVYPPDSNSFHNLGLGVITPQSCEIKEEINGSYELELTHLYDLKRGYLKNGYIISAMTPRGYQAFRIYKITPSLDNIKVNARHIFYDLLDNFIISFNNSGYPAEILEGITQSFSYETDFSFYTDIPDKVTKRIIIDKETPVSAILNNEEKKPKFIQAFGGELLRDNFNISILANIGEDKGFTVRYGKNLLGLTVDEDYSNIITRLYAYNKSKGIFIDSDNIDNYHQPRIGSLEIKEGTLKPQAEAYLKTVDRPIINIDVNFILLSKTENYKDYDFLEDVKLGDIVTIYNEKMNFKKKSKVISYSFDPITERYNKIILGEFKEVLTDTISTNNSRLNNVASESAKALANSGQGLKEINTIKETFAKKSDLDLKLDKSIYEFEKENFVNITEFQDLKRRVESLENRI